MIIKIKRTVLAFLLLVSSLQLFAQVNEQEPNDNLTDWGILTLMQEEVINGCVGYTDQADVWGIAKGTPILRLTNLKGVAINVYEDTVHYLTALEDTNLTLNPKKYYSLQVIPMDTGIINYSIGVSGEIHQTTTLAYMRATSSKSGVKFQWRTTIEDFNGIFILQGSLNRSTWEDVTFVKGFGVPSNYVRTVKNPTHHFWRLVYVNYEETKTISDDYYIPIPNESDLYEVKKASGQYLGLKTKEQLENLPRGSYIVKYQTVEFNYWAD